MISTSNLFYLFQTKLNKNTNKILTLKKNDEIKD